MNREEGYCIIEVTEEDMEVTAKWLARVKIVETEEEDEEGEIFINRQMVFELIRRFTDDDDLELYFEIAKLPYVDLSRLGRRMTCLGLG